MMTHPVDPRMPVLVGAGQFVHRGAASDCPSPLEMMKTAVDRASADAGLKAGQLSTADAVGVVGFTIDEVDQLKGVAPTYKNAPGSLAAAINAAPSSLIYTTAGGNTPQSLVNLYSERIAAGEHDFVVLAGAEFLGSLMKLLGAQADLSAWRDPHEDGDSPEMFGLSRKGQSEYEDRHGLSRPTNVYPIFENALRHHEGRSIEDHQMAMGRLFAPFTEVAANNPYAWFPTVRSADEIATESDRNRMVGWPYTKYLNSIIQVDQSAALIMMSTAKADELGVAQDKRVYLHGCADTYELWNPLDRVNYYSSPAIRVGTTEALNMAGKTVDDLSFFDLYSCFPIAVELACRELGISEDDPRGLTLTGGLPYFGGPGNNYAMHGIAECMNAVRAHPGRFGLSTANGWYLTKHAMGIYSTAPVEGSWERRPQSAYQSEIDGLNHPDIIEQPSGRATIETYTVVHDRDRIRDAIIVGRDEQNRRFVANTPRDDALYARLKTTDMIGHTGQVVSTVETQKNEFVPN